MNVHSYPYIFSHLVFVWIVLKNTTSMSVSVFAFFFFFWVRSAFLWLLCFSSGSRALFTGPTNPFSTKFSLKMGLTALFTHLKIILLQCFQFSVFNNK